MVAGTEVKSTARVRVQPRYAEPVSVDFAYSTIASSMPNHFGNNRITRSHATPSPFDILRICVGGHPWR